MPLKHSVLKLFALSLVISLASCANIPLKGGTNERREKVYLTLEKEIQKSIQDFSRNQDIQNEEGKISYLLYRVQKSKIVFMRNGTQYTNQEAAEFLRWKLNRPRWRPLVKTAKDFVNLITKGSVTSGEPYHAIFPNDEHRDLGAIMSNELDFLETHPPQQ